jgi:hypothetical protein
LFVSRWRERIDHGTRCVYPWAVAINAAGLTLVLERLESVSEIRGRSVMCSSYRDGDGLGVQLYNMGEGGGMVRTGTLLGM